MIILGEYGLWSFRYSVAKGYHWVLERRCTKETALMWLNIFENDEPCVRFKIAKNKPRGTK